MKEIWTMGGVPQRVEVLAKQQILKDMRQGIEINRYWIRGSYPYWGKVIRGWSGTETEVLKEWHWPTKEHPDKEYSSRIKR